MKNSQNTCSRTQQSGETEQLDEGVDRWFRARLHLWYGKNARSFAWRVTSDPYAILMAELMLHRTQARQVEPVFNRFLALFPSAVILANSSSKQVQEVLAPLGLGWRQANFVPLAMQLVERFGGQVPRDRESLLSLPGVGPYVSDAVRVLAFGESASLVDTNTVRVAGRFFGFSTHAESRRQPSVQKAVSALATDESSREANLALLDFAALVCRATNPLCHQCPVSECCAYWQRKQQHEGGQTDDHRTLDMPQL